MILTNESRSCGLCLPTVFSAHPDEIYFGRGVDVPERLAWQRQEARQTRLEKNRKAVWSRCPRTSREELAA